MRKTMIIPTYWCRKTGNPWQEGDAVYDHPTPVDQEGTLERTLVSMKQFSEKDFKLVILICPTTPEVEAAAYEQVLRIVGRAQLNAETYLFTAGDLREITEILRKAGLNDRGVQLLSMFGYSNVRNVCLLAASILTADAALLIDDDEVFELPDFVPRSLEFLGRRVYGDIVHGVAGYYLNSKGQYYDDVRPEPWMTYWDRFGCKARAFDQIIGSGPRLKRTPFAFGGAMILHRELFECVPFDPLVTRGEDVDYLINSRIFGFSFFLDNTLSIKHLPQPKSHPQWKRLREDIYRFVYQRAKMQSQHKTGNLVHVSPEDFDPYPGEFLKPDLDEKIYRSSMMLSSQYLANNDPDAAMEAMRNIYIAKHNAPPSFDAFRAYLDTQAQWERLIRLVRQERYAVRAAGDHGHRGPGHPAGGGCRRVDRGHRKAHHRRDRAQPRARHAQRAEPDVRSQEGQDDARTHQRNHGRHRARRRAIHRGSGPRRYRRGRRRDCRRHHELGQLVVDRLARRKPYCGGQRRLRRIRPGQGDGYVHIAVDAGVRSPRANLW